jgi:HK97 family phage major capsid protein
LPLPDLSQLAIGLGQGLPSAAMYLHHALGAQPVGHMPMLAHAIGVPFRYPDLRIGGFAGIEDWCGAVLGQSRGVIDPRLPKWAGSAKAAEMSAADRIGSEDPTQGQVLVHTIYLSMLLERIFNVDQILPRCGEQSIGEGFDSFEFPRAVDHDKAASPFAGLKVYWARDGKPVDWSKVAIDWRKYDLSPVRGLVRLGEKNLRDSAAVGSYVMRNMPRAFAYELSRNVFYGPGGNKPHGFVTRGPGGQPWPGSVVVSKGATGPGTVEADNIIDMYARMDSNDASEAVWTMNSQLVPALIKMKVPTGSGSGQLVGWMPPNGLSGVPYGTLFGRPTIPNPYSAAAGELGDIAFVNLRRYLTLRKGGMRMAMSTHFFFDTHDEAIRWEIEFSGFPEEDRKTKAADGSGFETSPYVLLQKRNA